MPFKPKSGTFPLPTQSVWSLSSDKDGNRVAPEQQLLDMVERLANYRKGRVGAHIHLSKLQQHRRREHYLRIATETFEAQVKTHPGQIFILSNQDIFFLCKDVSLFVLSDAVERLRTLFIDDPIAQYQQSDEQQDGFVTYFNLDENYNELLDIARSLHKENSQIRKGTWLKTQSASGQTPRKTFLPGDLSKLITILERADLTNILRRQTACALGEDGIPKPFFQEAYVSIEDLQRICTPDIDLLSDRWLFHYLTRTLDKRVLNVMSNGGINPDIPFSLNMNIHTLLSSEFRKFDAIVPNELRGKMVIEIHKLDVFSDIGAYLFARDYVRERGYLLCLDGLTQYTLPFFEKNKLDLDLYKIYWGANGLQSAGAQTLSETKALLAEFGERRIILCRCDNEEAISVGRDMGFTYFQGRMIDRLLKVVSG